MTNSNQRRSVSDPIRTDGNSYYVGGNEPRSPRSSGWVTGFLLGFLSSSVLWLGGLLWFTYFRNGINTAQSPTTGAVAPTQTSPNTTPIAPPTAPPPSTPLATSSPAAPTGGVGQAPAPVGLNLQQSHPNGSSVRVEEVAYGTDSISVTLVATNGADFDIQLNPSGDSMILRDDVGNRYNVAPPQNNANVEIPAGTTARGQFVFLGRVAPSATSLTLITSSKDGGSATSRNSRKPRLEVSGIPVKR